MNFDVLRPELIWVDGRCYRKLPVKYEPKRWTEEDDENACSRTDESAAPTKYSENADDAISCPIDRYAEDESKIHFEPADPKNPKAGFCLKMDIPNEYLRFVIGKAGETKKRLEFRTQTQISIPRRHQIGQTTIYGSNKMELLECRRQILTLVDSARQRQDPTHFLSIAFTSSDIRNNFETFKQLVLSDYGNCRGIKEDIFMKTEKLHLTIGVMVLVSESERNEAKLTLDLCRKEIIEPALTDFRTRKFLVKGLDYMNDDPAEVNVLYGRIYDEFGKEPIQLQALVDKILSFFSSRNLIVRQKRGDNVKMHVTLMNSKYGQSEKSHGRTEPFDAKKIIENFADFKFGVQEIDSLRISQRYALASDGYYLDTHKVMFSVP